MYSAYGVGIIIALLADYFFIRKLNLISTINVTLGFLIFTIVISFFTGIIRKFIK